MTDALCSPTVKGKSALKRGKVKGNELRQPPIDARSVVAAFASAAEYCMPSIPSIWQRDIVRNVFSYRGNGLTILRARGVAFEGGWLIIAVISYDHEFTRDLGSTNAIYRAVLIN